MTITDTTLNEVRSNLVSGIARHNRRRSRRKLAAFAPVAAIAIAIGLVVAQGDPSPAFALTELGDGTLRVEVFPEFDDVDDLQSSLQDAGLDAVVIQLRAHPSLEGVIEVSSHANEASGALEFDDGEFVIDVAEVEGEVEILIYSPADPGADYQVAPSVFAPDQALGGLHCAYPDQALSTAELEQRASDAGITKLTWTVFGEMEAETGTVDIEDFDQRPDGFVTGAQMRNADTLRVMVSTADIGPAADTINMSDGTHYRPTPTCTPELAANWD